MVESAGDPVAVGDGGRAVGIGQIHPCVVTDVNRVLGKAQYTLADRRSPAKSWEMFKVYCLHYESQGNPESWARLWNSGPGWKRKTHLTDGYWKKVKKTIDSML